MFMIFAQGTDLSDVLIAWGPVLAPIFAAVAAIVSAMYAKGAHTMAKHTDREVNNKKPGDPTLREIVVTLRENQEYMIKNANRHEELLCAIQDSLSQNDARIRHILSSLATFEADAQGRYIWVSRRWSEMTTLSLPDAVNRTWEETVSPVDRQRITDEWARATSLGETFGPSTYRLNTDISNTPVWVVAEASPVRNSDNKIVGYVGSLEELQEPPIF